MTVKYNEQIRYLKSFCNSNQDRLIYIDNRCNNYQSNQTKKSNLIKIFPKLCDRKNRHPNKDMSIFYETIKVLANIYKSYYPVDDFYLVNL
jgi:hypothetical protein